jgi:hypothetical protein
MKIKAKIATFVGDLWISPACQALWPWPVIVRNFPESKITGTDYRDLSNIILPGDMLLLRSDLYKITNKGIPERFTFLKHLAVFVGPVSGKEENGIILNPSQSVESLTQFKKSIVHAVSEGVVCQDLFELMKHEDYCAVVRPWSNSWQQDMIVGTALGIVGKEYDFEFFGKNRSYYCTEVGAACLKAANICKPHTIRINTSILGLILPFSKLMRSVYVADSFLCYKTVFVSKSIRQNKRIMKKVVNV